MCSSFRILGLFTIIPTSLLLTLSFFVLFTIRKTETKALKVFGHVIAALLWVAAAIVLSAGIYIILTGRHPMMPMMKHMMEMEPPMMHYWMNR